MIKKYITNEVYKVMKKVIKIENVKSFRKLEDPNKRHEKNKYVCYVSVHNVPHNLPMKTNPRDQKLTTNIAKGIKESLLSNDLNFHLKNRGMVFSAESVSFDNKTNDLIMVFSNEEEHGNIDGGHTYKIIKQNIYNPKFDKQVGSKVKESDQYVMFEIMVDVEDMIEDLAEARNKSVEVDDKSLAELQNKFDPIKDAIGGMPFYNRIAFKQNQQAGPGVSMIDAREVVAILGMFDIAKYGKKENPKQAYSSKKAMLDKYLENPEHYGKFSNIAIDIFDLYEHIETDFPYAYNNTGGKYGSVKFSGYNDGKVVKKSKFRQASMPYIVPDGLMYPLVGAFRMLVEYDSNTDKFKWKKNPMDVYDILREELAEKVMKFTRSLSNNPNAVGKDENLWDLLAMTVLIEIS